MSNVVVYMDYSEIRAGKLEDLKEAMNQLVGFIEANEPQILAYNVYLAEDGAHVSVFHVHRDAASLEFHMRVAGPAFPKFAESVNMLRIDVYGRPSDEVMLQLRGKAQMLGTGKVVVHDLHAGFARFG